MESGDPPPGPARATLRAQDGETESGDPPPGPARAARGAAAGREKGSAAKSGGSKDALPRDDIEQQDPSQIPETDSWRYLRQHHHMDQKQLMDFRKDAKFGRWKLEGMLADATPEERRAFMASVPEQRQEEGGAGS
eukprot:gene35972-9243_t